MNNNDFEQEMMNCCKKILLQFHLLLDWCIGKTVQIKVINENYILEVDWGVGIMTILIVLQFLLLLLFMCEGV